MRQLLCPDRTNIRGLKWFTMYFAQFYNRKLDCIAVIQDGKGALIGPLADKWGTFNPEYFIKY